MIRTKSTGEKQSIDKRAHMSDRGNMTVAVLVEFI